jgi:hypothetical protein
VEVITKAPPSKARRRIKRIIGGENQLMVAALPKAEQLD